MASPWPSACFGDLSLYLERACLLLSGTAAGDAELRMRCLLRLPSAP